MRRQTYIFLLVSQSCEVPAAIWWHGSDCFSPEVCYGTDKILEVLSVPQQISRYYVQSGNVPTEKANRNSSESTRQQGI